MSLHIASVACNEWKFCDLLKPGSDVSHSLAESTIVNEGERADKGVEHDNIGKCEFFTNEPRFIVEVLVDNLSSILKGLGGFFGTSSILRIAEAVVSNFSDVWLEDCDGPREPLINLCVLECGASKEILVT